MPFVTANILQPVIDVFEQVLLFFHNSVGLGWGMSIIALTVTVRAVLVPLTLKQFKSMQGLQRLAPEIKALQAKYKDDKQRLNQEMMKFYQENKVNPFGSCLPLILQAPVFISLFYMLRKDLKEDICGSALMNLAHRTNETFNASFVQNTTCGKADHPASFLFVPDLTSKATGVVLVVLIALYIGSQLLSSILMASATVDPNQRRLMLALPFVFTIFIFSFPAGLLVYWITTNLWTVGQQSIVRRTMGHSSPVAVVLPGTGDADEAGKGGGLFARLTSLGAPPRAANGVGAANGKSSDKSGERAVAGSAKAGDTRPSGSAPPPPPRKKKKRSGRRR